MEPGPDLTRTSAVPFALALMFGLAAVASACTGCWGSFSRDLIQPAM